MRLDPDNHKCRTLLKKARRCEELKDMGNEHLKNNQFDKAIEVYTEAIELDKCNIKLNSIIYANRGLVF